MADTKWDLVQHRGEVQLIANKFRLTIKSTDSYSEINRGIYISIAGRPFEDSLFKMGWLEQNCGVLFIREMQSADIEINEINFIKKVMEDMNFSLILIGTAKYQTALNKVLEENGFVVMKEFLNQRSDNINYLWLYTRGE